MFNKLRILHCPTITGGNPQNISNAEKFLGMESWAVAFQQNYLGYQCDEVLWKENTPLWFQQLKSWKLLFFAYKNFDVIHYNSGTSILPWDIPNKLSSINILFKVLLKIYIFFCRHVEQTLLGGKVIAVTFQGDDARQGDFSIKNFSISIAHDVEFDYYSKISDERKRNRIQMFDRYADLIYALNPDLLHVLPARAVFMPYSINVIPFKKSNKEETKRPLVIHAPSHRGAKGTKYILEAGERLREEDVLFDFLLIENLSNDQALKLYEKSDLVIDQLLVGWYGAFAVETMALKKPVICYLREDDLRFIPHEMRRELPLINANPNSIYDVLRTWLMTRKSDYYHKGLLSSQFVDKWHNPVRIAKNLIADYRRVALHNLHKDKKHISNV